MPRGIRHWPAPKPVSQNWESSGGGAAEAAVGTKPDKVTAAIARIKSLALRLPFDPGFLIFLPLFRWVSPLEPLGSTRAGFFARVGPLAAASLEPGAD